MHLKTLNIGPPGGFTYRQKESGFSMTGITFQALVKKVAQHRTNDNYPMIGEGYLTLSAEVEAQICERLSPIDQVALCDNNFRPVTSIHWTQVITFLKTLVAWFTTGFVLVPQEEAERRAAICINCPYNVGLSGCGGCKTAVSVMRASLLKATTSQDAGLQACGVCGCDNPTQVHVPLEVLRAGKVDLPYPTWCWKK
jgi:hypothetical protein